MPSVEWNRAAWSEQHRWEQQGDEWSGMAAACGQPYAAWKQSLIDTFLDPWVAPQADVLEIAPGHGRWTQHLLPRAATVTIVDINQSCLDACRERFDDARLRGFLTSGYELPFVESRSIDFAWSFDSFVHMDSDVIKGYLGEIARVLRPGGLAVIHHAGMRPASLRLLPVTRRLGTPGRVVQRLVAQGRWRDSGNRSAVSRDDVARWARQLGLSVQEQTQQWGDDLQHDVKKYGDWVTVLRQPTSTR